MPPKVLLVAALGDSGEHVAHAQEILQRHGLYYGSIDGLFGLRTQAAIRRFQAGWLVTGTIDAATWEALEVASARREVPVPRVDVPHGLGGIERTFGAIEFVEAEGGRVKITNGFDLRHIVGEQLPVVGRTLCHESLAPLLTEVLLDVLRKNLGGAIRSFAGFNARHKMHDPARGLSSHAWGIAFDVNAADNPVGTVGTMHPGIVQSFESFGFQWGGRWVKVKDPMHFQYCTGY
jgi:hypothetical protein